MAKCKDCLHFEACKYMYEAAFVNQLFPFGTCDFGTCDQYKDRSRFVELPCKVGDMVYFGDELRMWPAEVEGIRIRESGVYIEWVQFARSPEVTEVWDNGDFTTDDIGKTVFLTREEAEAELARRTANG